MEVKKTHIFLKKNEYSGMGGPKIHIIKVFECRTDSNCLASSPNSLYFKENTGKLSNELVLLSEKEVNELFVSTSQVLKDGLTS